MRLNHEGEYICVCERWEEPVLYPVGELIRCRDCKHYSPFTDELVSWCPIIGHKGLPEDAYCFKAEKREPNTHE